MFLIGSGGMAEAQVVKKSVKETPVVIEEEDEEDEEDYDDEEDDGDLDEEDDDDVVVPTEDEITVTDKEGNEELIEFPEAMTYDLDSLLNLYMSKTYLTGTNDCEMKDVNPTYSREIYIERLSRIPSVMELSYNDVVQKFIDRYAGRLRYSVSYMLGAMNFYMPVFEEALEAYQLPLELKYLPIIESALNPKAVSRVGAAGLWQFMPATGKQYGLELNSLVDERRDPVKSSYAAARYLKALYRIFGDWNLVIAAYNCGPENINKAIRRARAAKGKAQENDVLTPADKDYWHIYPYLPAETRGYVPAFIAATYIMNFYPEHGLHPKRAAIPLHTDTVMVERDMFFCHVAKHIGVEMEELRALNPQYRADFIPGSNGSYPLCLPTEKMNDLIHHAEAIFRDTEDSISRRPAAVIATRSDAEVSYSKPAHKHNGSSSYHKVRRGETLSSIAAKHGTTVSKLKKLNHLRSDRIRYGQRLRVK